MSHYGIIWVGYQCADLLSASLTPWVEAKRAGLGGHRFTICCVSVPFEGFPQETVLDNTRALLGAHAQDGTVDHVIVSDKPMKETEARGAALKWLVEEGVDVIWLVDSDEGYLESDILGAIQWVKANPFITWYRLPLRNYVFDAKTYLIEPFTPPRVFHVEPPNTRYRIHSFYDDNNVLYSGTITRDFKRDIDFASMTIPTSLCLPRHWSWMSDPRGKKKVEYQLSRGWSPSFLWDYDSACLVFNPYYTQPEICRET